MANDVWLIGHGAVTDNDKIEIPLPSEVVICYYTADAMDLPLDLVPIAIQSDTKGVHPIDTMEQVGQFTKKITNHSLYALEPAVKKRIKDAASAADPSRRYYLGDDGAFASFQEDNHLRLCTNPTTCNQEARDDTAPAGRHNCSGLLGTWREKFGIPVGPITIHMVACRGHVGAGKPAVQWNLHRTAGGRTASDAGRYRIRKASWAREVLLRAAIDPDEEYQKLVRTPSNAAQLTQSSPPLELWRDIMDKIQTAEAIRDEERIAFQTRYQKLPSSFHGTCGAHSQLARVACSVPRWAGWSDPHPTFSSGSPASFRMESPTRGIFDERPAK